MITVRKQISCINKPDRNDPYSSIEFIGGIDGNIRWKISEIEAISNINNGTHSYFVNQGGKEINVVVSKRNGKEYLRTVPDDGTANNLLSLNECPITDSPWPTPPPSKPDDFIWKV